MAKLYRYYVTGPGSFPEGMLRYDRGKIVREVFADHGKKFYEIESESVPTIERWRSFLWIVAGSVNERKRWNLPPFVGRDS